MRASEVIARLQALMEEHGDCEVCSTIPDDKDLIFGTTRWIKWYPDNSAEKGFFYLSPEVLP